MFFQIVIKITREEPGIKRDPTASASEDEENNNKKLNLEILKFVIEKFVDIHCWSAGGSPPP